MDEVAPYGERICCGEGTEEHVLLSDHMCSECFVV